MPNQTLKHKSESPQRQAALRGAGTQYAALPYRLGEGVEMLLISSRETGRWVLPKGWPMKGKTAYAAAAREALEEAGVKGKVSKRAFGTYSYDKRLSGGEVVPCTVKVYPLAVERQLEHWPEMHQRRFRWFSPHEAAGQVAEPELATLIESFAARTSAKREG